MIHRYLHDKMAGNFHDVWKHFLLSEYMDNRVGISDSLTYIDTHAGAIFYRNSQMDQLSTGLLNVPNALDIIPISPYKRVLEYFGASIETIDGVTYLLYPGSLGVASFFMINKKNKIIGCEINSDVAEKCEKVMKTLKRAIRTPLEFECIRSDGFDFALNYLNNSPLSETGIIFVDPAYFPDEHLDWTRSMEILERVFAKGTKWTFILFYCIYTNKLDSNKGYYELMLEYLNQNSSKLQSINLQLQVKPLTETYSKTITGLLIVNPQINSNEFLSSIISSGLPEIVNILKIKNEKWGPKITVEMTGVSLFIGAPHLFA